MSKGMQEMGKGIRKFSIFFFLVFFSFLFPTNFQNSDIFPFVSPSCFKPQQDHSVSNFSTRIAISEEAVGSQSD